MSGVEKIAVRVRVNGEPREALVEPRTLLVEFLRDDLNLTGTHIGCDTTYCGACTVLLNGRTVKSCTLFAPMADGGEITTVEGLSSNGALHPVQQAFAECHGLQCGFCTPGLLLSTVHLLNKNAKPTDKQIRKAIAGNTCRCTGYQNIFKAIRMAAGEMGKR
ncbi:MAG TPA: (2Fe-2S)-binding protein [Candidatus Limnocylindria bacterium]|nr:(2Fe-2S)-binding protein [Candidatus Limnocylindria bacterium]